MSFNVPALAMFGNVQRRFDSRLHLLVMRYGKTMPDGSIRLGKTAMTRICREAKAAYILDRGECAEFMRGPFPLCYSTRSEAWVQAGFTLDRMRDKLACVRQTLEFVRKAHACGMTLKEWCAAERRRIIEEDPARV